MTLGLFVELIVNLVFVVFSSIDGDELPLLPIGTVENSVFAPIMERSLSATAPTGPPLLRDLEFKSRGESVPRPEE